MINYEGYCYVEWLVEGRPLGFKKWDWDRHYIEIIQQLHAGYMGWDNV